MKLKNLVIGRRFYAGGILYQKLFTGSMLVRSKDIVQLDPNTEVTKV